MLARIVVPFVDTSAAALSWTLSAPSLPALASLTLELGGDNHLQLAVLGSSHQARLVVGTGTVRETVACHLDHADALPRSLDHTIDLGRYRIESRVDQLDPLAFHDVVERLVTDLSADDRALVARFRGHPDAITAVAAQHRGHDVMWQTWHAYPQTAELVSTSTTVTVR